MKHCVFRARLDLEATICTLRVDDYVKGVYYNNVNMLNEVVGDKTLWNADKTVTITPVVGAYLAIWGEDKDGNFFGGGGFWADCGAYLPKSTLATNWESHCSSNAPSSTTQTGVGDGWSTPTFNAGRHWEPGTLGDSGMKHCVFRARLDLEAPTIEAALGSFDCPVGYVPASRADCA